MKTNMSKYTYALIMSDCKILSGHNSIMSLPRSHKP